MTKYTIKDFRAQYPSDTVCLDKIFQLRYGKLTHCPECAEETTFKRISTRRSYQCRKCYTQFYPTAGTVFEKTRTPLSDWFFIIYMFTTTRNGVSAKEIERALGVTYKCAFRMGHKIRELISGIDPEMLKGFVEFDEAYSGGIMKNKSNAERKEARELAEGQKQRIGRNSDGKTPIFAMVERMGRVRAYVMPKIRKEAVYKLIKDNVDRTAIVSTDESRLYDNLNKQLGFEHGQVNHSASEYKKGIFCTNTVEGFFSQVKRTIKGTHISVSEKYLQSYVNECAFRYNNRGTGGAMFGIVLDQIKHVGE
ncbi:MAG: IS1595 family transposase [Bacteroidetes bacterium]|nr:IS1595 family transposase [Bacteroidota bacterium]